MTNVEKIRQLNDELRTKFKGGRIAVTPGVMALGDLTTILNQLRQFSAFDEDNDPHQEHDFGAFKYEGRAEIAGKGPLLFFKIDYYDPDLMMGSSDPADPAITSRVLTVMLAEEY